MKNPILQGEKRTIEILYQGYLAGYTETGMLYVKDHIDRKFTILRPDCLAYPQVGYPSWYINRAAGLQSFGYLIRVNVPSNLVVANGGRLINRILEDGVVSYSYKNIKHAWRMDVAVAEYEILEDTSN